MVIKTMQQLNSKEIFGADVPHFTLFPIQANAVQWLRYIESGITDVKTMGGGILADDMGLGKTKDMAALCAVNVVPTTLLIAPLNTIIATTREFIRTARNLKIYHIRDEKLVLMRLHNNKLIWSDLDIFEPLTPAVLIINSAKIKLPTYRGIINRYNWFRILIDEAHELRNGAATDIYESMLTIPQPIIEYDGRTVRFGSRFAFTGTPIQNGEDDLIWLFKWVYPDSFRDIKIRDKELRIRITKYLFRRNRNNLIESVKQFMKFPDKEPNIITEIIQTPKTQLSEAISNYSYSKIVESLKNRSFRDRVLRDERAYVTIAIAEWKNESKQENDMLRLQGVISYPFRSSLIGDEFLGTDSKFQRLLEIIRSRNGESFVIFHNHLPVKDKYIKLLPEYLGNSYKYFQINGDVNLNLRDQILMESNDLITNGESVILFSSIRATAEGLNYQKFSNMILLDQDANPQNELQAMSRIYRTGQLNEVMIWVLKSCEYVVYGQIVDIDKRITDIKNQKIPQTNIIETYNAAWYFRKYYFIASNGQRISGLTYDDEFNAIPSGTPGGPDSIGPLEIN